MKQPFQHFVVFNSPTNSPNSEKTSLVEKPVDDTSLDIDCVWELSPCSLTCGDVGRRSFIIKTKPRGRGSSCPAITEEQCYTPPCPSPVDCSFTWSEWTTCSASCNGGVMTRKAKISIPHQNEGEECPADEEKECNTQPCIIDCSFTWSEWSNCPPRCDGGVKTRKAIISIPHQNGGDECPADEEMPCCPTGWF